VLDVAERLGSGLDDLRPRLREGLADDGLLVLGERLTAGLDGRGLGEALGLGRRCGRLGPR